MTNVLTHILIKKGYIFFVTFFLLIGLYQNHAQIIDIGLPFINNFSRESYNAETQNWSITQDEEGVMHFANNAGLLCYNGSNWELNPLPNRSIVRTVKYIDKKIYAGGYNEFGYFEKDIKGNMLYTSLSSKLKPDYANFDEIWRIFKHDDAIIFQSYLYIFIYENEEFKVIEPLSRFGFSYQVNDVYYIIDRQNGIFILKNDSLVQYLKESNFFEDNEITFLIPYKQNEMLIGTANIGIYHFDGIRKLSWNTEVNTFLKDYQIYTGIELDNKYMAIGTVQNGIFIIDKGGKIHQQVNRSKGLQNNTVLSLFFDHSKNLWLGLDNGIDMVELNAPFTIFNYVYNIETAYTSLVHKNFLYVGTNQGLFVKEFDKIKNSNLYDSKFEMVNGTQGQVWKLEIIEDQLICGHNLGTFIIDEKRSKQISNIPGGWDFELVPWNNNLLIGGTYSGLVLYEKDAFGNWKEKSAINGFSESSKELAFDENNNLWITHGIKGVYKIELSNDCSEVAELKHFISEEGNIQTPHNLVKIRDQIYILSDDRLLTYNAELNDFQENVSLAIQFDGASSITRIIEDSYGDIWYFSENNIGVNRLLEDGSYINISKPFNRIKNLFISASYENIYRLDEVNCLIGSQDGLLYYSPNAYKNFEEAYQTYICGVHTYKKNRDTTAMDNDAQISVQLPINDQAKIISYQYNSIQIEFYTPFFEAPRFVEHSYRLLGFSDQWSEWENVTYKEFTNLLEGKYVFEVKAKNIYDNESEIARYQFEIKPPVYRSTFAYFFYVFLIFIFAIILVIYIKHQIDRTRKIEEEKLKTAELEFEKEVKQSEAKIEELEQEKMKNEMRLKNIELANSTMNLIQKNKLLNKLKKQLVEVSDKARSNVVKVNINEIIARIDKDLTSEKHLKVFDKYFDQVHQDFIKRLREKHPVLTPKDLRLCAYLRMNLSTKEIAPLMNVSIRGLEISRYRLRKKLDIDREVNLVEYIMEV